MTADWTLPPKLEDELTAEHVPKLGLDPFWRQVQRFIGEHARRGTVDTEAGFAELLRGWLERANANRAAEPPPAGDTGTGIDGELANGRTHRANGHDPPVKRRGRGSMTAFMAAGIRICEQARSKAMGTKFLMQSEDFELKIQLHKIFHGEDQVLGVEWGPNLSPDELFALLPQFDANALEKEEISTE